MSEDEEKMASRAVGQLMKRVLMVPPEHFTVEYNINPWMGGTVDKAKAHEQWTALKNAIEKEGVQVLTMNQTKGLPDQVFVCNSGLVLNNQVYLSKFRHKERTGEQEHYVKWFQENGIKLHGTDYPEYFEGGGDAVFSDYNTLWAGFGPRSSKNVYDKIKVLGSFETVICELTDPNFYHLDTCFAPVDESTALWYPPAFSEGTKKEILRRLPNSIEVSKEEANAFVCNAITIRNTVISPIGVSQRTRDQLAKRGFAVTEVDMSEYMKSGGASKTVDQNNEYQIPEDEFLLYKKYKNLLCWSNDSLGDSVVGYWQDKDKYEDSIEIKFQFADCGDNFANYTMSVLIGAVDFHSRLTRLEKIYIKEDAYTHRTTIRTVRFPFAPVSDFKYLRPCEIPTAIKKCFSGSSSTEFMRDLYCFRRADVVFIDFEYDAAGEVALEKLEITINSKATSEDKNIEDKVVTKRFVHPIMMPCNMIFEERAIYQIGPSNGMFRKTKSFPELGDIMGGVPPFFAY